MSGGSWDAMLAHEEQQRISSQAGLASLRAGATIATCPEPGCGARLGVPVGWWIEHEADGSHTACAEPFASDGADDD